MDNEEESCVSCGAEDDVNDDGLCYECSIEDGGAGDGGW